MGTFEVMEMIGIFLLIAGFVLVGIEMVVPGFGAPGISGIVCLILGIIGSADSVEQGITITILVLVVLAVMMTVSMLVLKKVTPPIVLQDSLKPEGGFLSSQDLDCLIGKVGVATTDLRPCGKCRIDGVDFDVRTDGNYIVKGARVIIRNIHESTIIVMEIRKEAAAEVRTNINERQQD